MQRKSDRKRQSKGCYKLGVKAYLFDSIKFSKCPGNYTKEIEYYLEAFSLYEKGMLPFKGNLGEQPNKIVEIFNIISSRRAKQIKKDS